MDEFELIRRYFVRQGRDDGVLVGIGDDGAVMMPAAGCALVSVVDTLVDGVHWPVELPPRDVGYRSVAVNVSDIAAMGARPRWMTLALTLAAADESWLTEFSAGLFEAADRYRSALVGGDVTRGSQTVVSVQITGEVDPRSILERSGASPGEGIYVTGTTGDAAAGLALVRRTLDAAEEDRRFLVHRFARPEIAVEFAASIAPFAGGAIDLSDGLFADAGKLLAASGAGGRIEVTSLPRSAALERAVPENERLQLLLAGGDDYELCFTAAAANEERVLEAAERHAVRVTKIGEVTDGSRLFCTRAGIEIDFTDRGYRHF